MACKLDLEGIVAKRAESLYEDHLLALVDYDDDLFASAV